MQHYPHYRIAPRFAGRLLRLPFTMLFLLWICMVLGFAGAYYFLSPAGGSAHAVTTLPEIADTGIKYLNALYFSIVTATTLGYGDMVPLGASRALAAVEGMLGFFLFAVIISKFVSHKQEIALGNVHKLAFQDAFFKTREGFFVLRRDCDAIGEYARTHHALNEKCWSNFLIVCQKGQTLLEGILDFYDESGLYTIDRRREQLLLDGVHRTLTRMRSLLTILGDAGVRLRKHSEAAREFHQFAAFAKTTVSRWRTRSHHENNTWFKKISLAANDLVSAK